MRKNLGIIKCKICGKRHNFEKNILCPNRNKINKKKGVKKMIKVKILDDTGHSELAVATIDELKEKVDLTDKFIFCDGKYTNIVDLNGIVEIPREITITERLIGG